jgi:hypothetical protein
MAKVQLKILKITHEVWNAESEGTRYAVLLLGHIFNEVIMLQKMSVVSLPRGDETAQGMAMAAQTTFLARLLSGKIYEAYLILNNKAVNDFLSKKCHPFMLDERGQELRNGFNKAVDDCKWLNLARNQHAMHYPTPEEWAPAIRLMQADKADYEWIGGEIWGYSFYASSAQVAAWGLYLEAGETARVGVIEFSEKIKDLATKLIVYIVESTDAYFRQLYPDNKHKRKAKLKDTKQFELPLMIETVLPFFYDLTNMQGAGENYTPERKV